MRNRETKGVKRYKTEAARVPGKESSAEMGNRAAAHFLSLFRPLPGLALFSFLPNALQ